MWNQIFENNSVDGTGTPCEGPSSGKIEGDIKRLRQEVNFLEREVQGELGLKKEMQIE